MTGVCHGAEPAGRRVLDGKRYHLGTAGLAEWQEFAGSTPHGRQLEIAFDTTANEREATLFIRQRDVKGAWNVTLNGRSLGRLETLRQPLVRAFAVPARVLHTGANRLVITPPSMVDDIVVGEVSLDARPLAEALGGSTLEVNVREADTNAEIPCRLTLTDTEAALAPLQAAAGQTLAVRTGVIYSGNGKASLTVSPGEYSLHASRGFEYSVATQRFAVRAGETKALALTIRREVPTPGLIAADSHIHTLTHSGHGDATIDERMMTIAGEGIELAIATDHNKHIDFAPVAQHAGVGNRFRSVVGNEVTTKVGHFNAFPVAADGAVPNAQLTDWTELLHNIRTVTAARVVTLNHPRDLHSAFTPFGPQQFDAVTGELRAGEKFGVDAIEVVTSAAMQSDIMQLYRDWFALLNRGHRIAGIAASDTHHVSEFILGQARTYVVAHDTAPRDIDIAAVCESYRAGRLLVSLGLLANMKVDERFAVGDLATGSGSELRVTIDVHGPSWVTADRVELYANGVKIRETTLTVTRAVDKAHLSWTIPRPAHDVHLVAIATGPGVTGPWWEIPQPYQPTSKEFVPRVIGSTNPIWIDGDGDGRFTSARGYAALAVSRAGGDAAKLIESLASFDQPVAVQAADLWRKAGNDLAAPAFVERLRTAPAQVREGFGSVKP
ncbi:MAG TPA: CehA/McbA family metallohydrolase [Opitutaceae bacterium]|nr:CehA/McbA family metallohydrolase [Opitutaceae bacterium]